MPPVSDVRVGSAWTVMRIVCPAAGALDSEIQ